MTTILEQLKTLRIPCDVCGGEWCGGCTVMRGSAKRGRSMSVAEFIEKATPAEIAPPVERVGEADILRRLRELQDYANEIAKNHVPCSPFALRVVNELVEIQQALRSRAVPQVSAEPSPDGGERLREGLGFALQALAELLEACEVLDPTVEPGPLNEQLRAAANLARDVLEKYDARGGTT